MLGLAAALAICAHGGVTRGRAESPARIDAPSAPGPAASAIACAKVTDAAQLDAIAEAERLLHQRWLKRPTSLFMAFAAKIEKRNPFDLSPRPAEGASTGGFVEVMAPRCTVVALPGADTLLVRFTAPFYRYHEPDTGWSRPLRNGLVLEADLRRNDAGWQARDTKPEIAVIEPDEPVRRPAESELPKLEPWAEPVPGCGRRERWTGTDCVRRKR